jgi:outer membrane receptor for ferric coprogen and ferric-rhodotorulic acid
MHLVKSRQQKLPRVISHLLLMAAIGTGQCLLMPSSQANPQQNQHYQIAAASLNNVLIEFATQAAIELSFDPLAIRQLSSSGLSGKYSIQEGLEKLLAPHQLEAAPHKQGYVIVPKDKAKIRDIGKLDVINIAANNQDNNATQLSPIIVNAENNDSYTVKSSSSATGLNLSLQKTPQSVSVITRKQMEDFNILTFQDLVKATPGLYSAADSTGHGGVTAYSRGFAVQKVNVDGMRQNVYNYNQQNLAADMIMYDQVEVVRGATGLLDGAGTPSASINMIRKRPTKQPLLNLTASYGSWNNQQYSIDASHGLNSQGTIRGRAVGYWKDSDSFVDVTNTTNGVFYGIIEADIFSNTKVALGGSIQRTRTDGLAQGLPAYADGDHMNLSRSTFLFTPDSYKDRDTDTLFADLEHTFSNGWKLKAAAQYSRGESAAVYGVNYRITGSTTTLSQSESGWGYDTEQNIFNIRLNGDFNLFNRQHEFLLAATYQKDNSGGAQLWSSGSRVIEIYNYDPYAYRLMGQSATNPWLWGTKTEETGLVGSVKLQLLEPLQLILGAHLDWFHQNNTKGWYRGTPSWTRSKEEDAKFVPYLGLNYDLDHNHSLYGSITEIFEPQTSLDKNGNTLESLTGTNYELGIKGEYFDAALNSSLSIFRLIQQNRAVTDEENCPTSGSITCYRAAGEVQSNGIELQLTGALTPNWQLSLGYTYTKTKYTKDDDAANIGQPIDTGIPRQLLKIFTNYQLPAPYNKINLMASIYGQSKIYNSDTDFYTAQNSYAIVDIGGTYQVNKNLSLQLNLNNLLDKHYYTNLDSSWSGYGAYYGTPRNIFAKLKYKF